jgi:diguanylate cyclase (GGDEF)-like protein
LIRINDALEKRISRFTDLRKFSEEIIASLDLNELLQIIARKALEIIGRGEVCLIYLFDRKSEALSLASSFTLSSKVKIKAKTGDPCEYWVFRQRVPLLITDILRDFRFDSEEVLSYGREFRSLISTPIISRNKFLGLIRIDSPFPEGFTADDLRLLDIIADLSAIAIDNAFLFRKMETLATHDSLTGFYLRREFINIIQRKKEEPSLKEGVFSLLMLDIDDFKNCNDRFGHIAGDMVLKNISQVIRAHLVEEEYPCRYGGEEFLLFLKGRNRENLIQRAELIRGAVEASLLKIRRQLIKVTISIGIAIFPQDGSQIKELIEVADARLYKAKKAGKNRVVYD